MITKCMPCLLHPNQECHHCGRKYARTNDHTCEIGDRHIFGTCVECRCDQCEGVVRPVGEVEEETPVLVGESPRL